MTTSEVTAQRAFGAAVWSTRRFFAYFLPGWLAIAALLLVIELREHARAMESLRGAEARIVDVAARELADQMRFMVTDLLALTGHIDIRDWIEGGERGAQARLAAEFVSFLEAKEEYDQVTILDLNGLEFVRVHRLTGAVQAVPPAGLQSRTEHFHHASTLPEGAIHVSRFGLATEAGSVDVPLRPTLRLGTTLRGRDGSLGGVLELSLSGAGLLQVLSESTADSRGVIQLIDAEGFWLKGRSPEDEWGFILPGREDRTFESAYPGAWSLVHGMEKGQTRDPDGLVTFTWVRPLSNIGPVRSIHIGEEVGTLRGPAEYGWTVVSAVTPMALGAVRSEATRAFLLLLGLLTPLTAGGAGLLAYRTGLHRQAEAEVRLQATALQASANAIVIADIDGTILWVNPAFSAMTGYPADEAVGQSTRLLRSGEQGADFYEDLWETVLAGEVWRGEMTNRKKDGTLYAEEQVITPLLGPDGRPLYFIAIKQDVTAPRRAEQALRESREQFRAMFQNAAIGMAVVGPDGAPVLTNRALQTMLGYGPDELTRMSFVDLTHPDDVEVDLQLHAELVVGERESYELEKRYIKKDGEVVWGEVAVSLARDDDGQPLFAVSMVNDVTVRRRAQEEHRHLIERAPYGVYRSDLQGNLLAVNPALVEMLGYGSEEELLACNFDEHLHVDPGDGPRLRAEYANAERIDGVEVELRRKDGSHITVSLRGQAVRDSVGKVDHLELFAEDVTVRRHLESQLRQSQKMEAVGQLTGGIAHDFNNLLTVISTTAELTLHSPPDEPEELKDSLLQIVHASQRGADMIKKLLGIGRREILALQPVRLSRLVTGMTDVLRRLLPESIEIELTVQESEGTVQADAGAVEQMLMNLATNARDAMPAGGTLSIEVSHAEPSQAYLARRPWMTPGAYVTIAVKDTGVGMDQETVEHIFEPFYTKKPAGQGSGLGMAMVYGLMKQHGGWVHVSSEMGRGSEVQLSFPAVDVEEVTPAQTAYAEAELPSGSETVLVVEDEAALRLVAQRVLERCGYSVLLAADGEEALEILQRRHAEIDLVLTDLVMPRLGGRRLLDASRQRGHPVKFLFTSGYSDKQVPDDSTKGPVTPFLRKPWSVTELAAAVRETLDSDQRESDVG